MKDVIAENRGNIPAICRIPGRGTAVLVAPGLLLTGLEVVRSKPEAAKMTAVFFESGKQAPVVVDLKPFTTFFCSAYPEHLSYALVACDTKKIHHVAPVKLPFVESEWATVEEGDICLIVQHPLPLDMSADEPCVDSPPVVDASEVKRFEEVLTVTNDGAILNYKVNTQYNSSGSPVFNSKGLLVGLHSQLNREDGLVSQAVVIQEIVRHLFVNGKISLFDTVCTPREIWQTWYHEGDIVRTLRIMQNFQHTEVIQRAMGELCRYSGNEMKLKEIMEHNGATVILENFHRFRIDEAVVCSALRTLWNLSFGDDSRRKEIVANGGLPIIIQGMEKFCKNEEVVEYGCVLLYNLSSLPEHVTSHLCEKGIPAVLKAVELYPTSEVIIKFTLGVLMNVAKNTKDDEHVNTIVQLGGIERACSALTECSHNEYLVENSVLLLSAVVAHRELALHPALRACVIPLIRALKVHHSNKTMAKHGNQALWYLGLDPANRVVIARNGGLEVLDSTIDAVAQTLGT